MFPLLISCAPQSGDYISSNVPAGGGYGTEYYKDLKITGKFSADRQTCTGCNIVIDLPNENLYVLVSDVDMNTINGDWKMSGLQKFNIYWDKNKSNEMEFIGTSGKNCKDFLCNMKINKVNYKNESYLIDASTTKDAKNIVFEKIREKEKIAKEKKQKEKDERLKQERIAKNKILCTEMGFSENTDGMSNCILQLLTKTDKKVIVNNSNNDYLDEQNEIMEEQTRIMKRKLRQQRLKNLRESQKTFQKMIDGTCSFC